MTLPDASYIAFQGLETLFRDKDTALPLAGGYVEFYSDDSRSVPKDVYQISDTSPYTFTNIGSVVQLNAAGAFQSPNDGSDIQVYAYPYDAAGEVELYFLKVYSADNILQFTRPAQPANAVDNTDPIDLFEGNDNQISNCQFVEMFPNRTFSVTGTMTTQIAPDWYLDSIGTGSITYAQLPITDITMPTGAPYAVEITSSGISSLKLRQRISESPRLMGSGYIFGNFVAKSFTGAAIPVSMDYLASNGYTVNLVNKSTSADGNWNTLNNATATQISTTNTNSPLTPGYVDIVFTLPATTHVGITSVQIVMVQNANSTTEFLQESVPRQIDHLFHYFKDSLLYEARTTILPAWSFGLNPWQYSDPTAVNVLGAGVLGEFGYSADNTILIQQAYVDSLTGGNISFTRATAAQNYGFKVTAVKATNQFAIIYYLDSNSARPIWDSNGYLSSRVKIFAQKQNAAATLGLKMRILYRTSQPPTITRTEPIATWSALGEPVYAAGWTAIAPLADPTMYISAGINTFDFEAFQNVASSSDDMTMAVVLYTTNPMVESGTADYLTFESVSLTPTRFSVDVNPMTPDHVLRSCQYTYQKSFPQGVMPAQNTGSYLGASFGVACGTLVAGVISTTINSPSIQFFTPMFATPGITKYNPSANNANVYNVSTAASLVNSTAAQISKNGFYVHSTPSGADLNGDLLALHWTASCRLGN